MRIECNGTIIEGTLRSVIRSTVYDAAGREEYERIVVTIDTPPAPTVGAEGGKETKSPVVLLTVPRTGG